MNENLPISNLTTEQINLIKQTVAKGTSDTELQLFLYTCKRTGLDPLARQIHAIKRWDGRAGREIMVIQTGIDGYRLTADRTGAYAPGDITVASDGSEATASVKKLVAGTWHVISATAYFAEYCQRTKEGNPVGLWARMPKLMLGKCAEALALRRAFPAELSGVYTHEEMQQADTETPSKPSPDQHPEGRAIEQAPPPAHDSDDLDTALGTTPPQAVKPAPTPGDMKAADKRADCAHQRSLVAMKLDTWMEECGVTGENAEKMRHIWVETFYGLSRLRELTEHDIGKLYRNLVLAETPKAQEYVAKVKAWIKLQAHLFGGAGA